MPHVSTRDGTRLYYEEAGQGSPVVFVHEYAGDWRTWEPHGLTKRCGGYAVHSRAERYNSSLPL